MAAQAPSPSAPSLSPADSQFLGVNILGNLDRKTIEQEGYISLPTDEGSAPSPKDYAQIVCERIIVKLQTHEVPDRADIDFFKKKVYSRGSLKSLIDTINLLVLFCPPHAKSQEIFAAFHNPTAEPSAPVVLMPANISLEQSVLSHSFAMFSKSIATNPAAEKAEKEEAELRQKQTAFATTFLEAIFKDYVFVSLPALQDKLFHAFTDPKMKAKLQRFFAPQAAPLELSARTELVQLGVANQFEANFQGLRKTLAAIVGSERLQAAFSKTVLEWMQKSSENCLSKETQELLQPFLAQYVPASLLALLDAAIPLLQTQVNFQKLQSAIYDPKFDTFEICLRLICFLIQQDLTGPITDFVKTLFEKLGASEQDHTKLFSLLKGSLIPLFFSNPQSLPKNNKKMIVALFESLIHFLGSFNRHLKETTRLEGDAREQAVIDRMFRELLPQEEAATASPSVDLAKTILDREIQSFLWAALYPHRKGQETEATFFEEATVLLLSSTVHRFACDLVSPSTITLLLPKLFERPISVSNPFERPMPKADLFAVTDTTFSEELNDLIKVAIEEGGKLTESWLLRKAAGTAAGLLKSMGKKLHRTLTKMSNSGDALMPALLASQILYEIPEIPKFSEKDQSKRNKQIAAAQGQYMTALGATRKRRLDLKKFLTSSADDLARIKRVADHQLLTDPKTLKQFLDKALPAGTDVVTSVVQQIYRYLRHELFEDILLIHLFRGLTPGLENGLVHYLNKYPKDAEVAKLPNTLELKRWWLYSEWHPKCQFSQHVQRAFPMRAKITDAPSKTVLETFHAVRGQYKLWGEEKEKGKWKRVFVKKLDPKWVKRHVEVPQAIVEEFAVKELNGIVLWKDPAQRKYQLLEGHRRVSVWLGAKEPEMLEALLYFGKPRKDKK